ncbi:MAG: DnaJ domain-containing protein [bacterium]|nr:DnaJ domain-containing protein [bacterium]
MGILGAIIGGSLGLLVGGPFGALLGGALGANVKVNAHKAHPGSRDSGPSGYSPLQDQQTFMLAMISLAAKVAKADGKVTADEVKAFDDFLRTNLHMDATERQIAARIFNEARDSHIPAEEFASQMRRLMGHRRDRLRDMISLLMMIAMADGHFHSAEEKMIRSIASHMGLTTADYEAAAAMFDTGTNLQASYSVLGISESATDGEVKKAYRNLAREYHPDVLASKGMGEEFTAFAEDKMKSINNAYSDIKKDRGL